MRTSSSWFGSESKRVQVPLNIKRRGVTAQASPQEKGGGEKSILPFLLLTFFHCFSASHSSEHTAVCEFVREKKT